MLVHLQLIAFSCWRKSLFWKIRACLSRIVFLEVLPFVVNRRRNCEGPGEAAAIDAGEATRFVRRRKHVTRGFVWRFVSVSLWHGLCFKHLWRMQVIFVMCTHLCYKWQECWKSQFQSHWNLYCFNAVSIRYHFSDATAETLGLFEIFAQEGSLNRFITSFFLLRIQVLEKRQRLLNVFAWRDLKRRVHH